jgi:hypothetical protein
MSFATKETFAERVVGTIRATNRDEADRDGDHKDLPARKSASFVRKKSETRIATEEVTTA